MSKRNLLREEQEDHRAFSGIPHAGAVAELKGMSLEVEGKLP